MTYSRPWMFLGLAQIGLGLVMLCQQGQPPDAGNPAKADSRASQREGRRQYRSENAAAGNNGPDEEAGRRVEKPLRRQDARRLEGARVRRRRQGLRQGWHNCHGNRQHDDRRDLDRQTAQK